ncbi:DUF3152 domain-containing protein [Kibdelosporangium philippinense]|uniref:DUF3152 domain-containing protein n=1 Tax=Kibdelosporangium philippinense TaxID=211113 RepID=A0ABS8Z9P4_9PSEU|nr:DUF3152 domain-containing protein [Kibdelosporangium philippinense]MCE7004590.1 DUF3152 domain-containing protein [Kibdelosporangium philippinense]
MGEPLVAAYDPEPPRRARGRRSALRTYRSLVVAVPLLMAVTAVTVVDSVEPSVEASRPVDLPVSPGESEPSAALSNPGGPTVEADGAPTPRQLDVPSAQLPTGGPFPLNGAKTFRVVPGTSDQVGTGKVHSYTVEVEDAIEFTDGERAFAGVVQATLSHPKSWIGSGAVALRRVETGTPDLRVTLASQATARRLCGFAIPYDTSCFLRAKPGHVVLSAARWERGAHAFHGDIGQYRRYVINHEVGHYFNNGHKPCAADGGMAPLMMQQTLTTSNDELAKLVSGIQNDIAVPRDGKVCKPNEWAFPSA